MTSASDRMYSSLKDAPAYMADAQAFRRGFDSHRVRPISRELDQLAVADEVGMVLGCHLALPLAIRTYADGTEARLAQVVLHTFNSPTEAEIAVLCSGFSWTRAALVDLILWASFDLGLERLTARIRFSDHHARELARRAGFKFQGWDRGHFANGEDASVWRLDLDPASTAGLIGRLYPGTRLPGTADAACSPATVH